MAESGKRSSQQVTKLMTALTVLSLVSSFGVVTIRKKVLGLVS